MPVTFTRAPTVAKGDKITAPQFAALAAAFNDRLVSGLGDGPWRILFYLLGLFRQVRNPDETGNAFPSLGEFFEVYQHVDPMEYEWPVTGPGQPEGANLASVMNAFVFGAEAFGLDDEATRLAALPWATSEPSDLDAWELAKAQRGTWDPETGGVASPSFTAARSHWRIRYSRQSPHGNSYGGFAPTPEYGTACTDPEFANVLYKFTRIADGSTVTYSGTCPDEPSHVAAVVSLPWSYYVFLNDGTIDILPSNEWSEGPYTGEGRLTKQSSQGISQVLNTFAREFRGSSAQREGRGYHLQKAFDFQRFCATQYNLAPQRGQEWQGIIQSIYPGGELTSDKPAGTAIVWNTGGTKRAWHPGAVLTAFYVEATNLLASVRVEILEGSDVFETIEIQPGASGQIIWPAAPFTPTSLSMRVASPLQFKSGTGSLLLEFTELMRYKPNVHDFAVFLRVATASSGTPDGVGTNENEAKSVSDLYFKKGCLLNINGQAAIEPAPSVVNRNAIWDAARRLSRVVRLIRRTEVWLPNGYAVENGKSVLWFKRHIQTVQGAPDAWEGIGPAKEKIVSGDIREGVLYHCRTATGARYNGQAYQNGDTFAGLAGKTEYEGECWEYSGIMRTAPPGGYSNRWLLGVELKPYRIDENSIWKPSQVADYFPIQNRCHVDALDVGGSPSLRTHFAYGQTSGGRVRYPESPAGYNYADLGGVPFFGFLNANGISCDPLDTTCLDNRQSFYRSCRIYEPDVEIESTTWETGVGNEEVLKVTLTGRLHHCHTVAGPISRDSSTWNISDLDGEPYRTAENGIRQYIVQQTTGRNLAMKIGDQGANGSLETLTDAPIATCFPTFRLTKLVPEPYIDGKYTPLSPRKTHLEHDPLCVMELYLRAMCEGYVDGETSQDYACAHATESLFDFTFQSLCMKAIGNKWLTFLPFDTIEDNRQGHGPLPNTEVLHDHFNDLARCVNLLDTVRVMLPCTPEKRVVQAVVSENVVALAGDGTPSGCGGGEVYRDLIPPVPEPDVTTGTWEPAGGGHDIRTTCTLTGACAGSLWVQETKRDAVEFRYAPADEDLQYALPDSWRGDFLSNPRVLVTVQKLHNVLVRKSTAVAGSATDCAGAKWAIDGSHWWIFQQTALVDETVCLVAPGTFVAPEIDATSSVFWSASGCLGGPEYLWSISLLSTATGSLTVPLVGAP